VNHILTKQVFGIGITQITSLLARRSVYCSKHAKGKHSIAKSFASDDGNIWFKRIKHTWDGDKCKYCGAGKSVFDRAKDLKPTPTRSFTPTTSRLGSPRYLEAICNST
jgi:site-specific DNA-methyltransferase (adenine-specific)